MTVKPPEPRTGEAHVLRELRDGFAYVRRSAPIRSILVILGLISLVGMPFQILMPVYAKDVLGSGARAFGFLIGCSGLGALAGAAYLASRRSVLGLERSIVIAAALFGAGLIALAFSRLLWLSLLLMLVTGFGSMVQMASSNTMLQTLSDDDKRGRVMGFYTIAYRGMVPIGSLLAGTLAAGVGAPATLALCGVCCILGAAQFAGKLRVLREDIRPIYVRMGILPEASPSPRSRGAGI
jgi:MFS family permease